MPFTAAGRPIFLNAIAMGLTNGQLTPIFFGIGDGDAPFDESQNDLQGATKIRAPMLANYPRAIGPTVEFVADFEVTNAFQIAEFAFFTAASGGTMIWRSLTGDLGQAFPPHTWHPAVTLTINLAAP